MVIMVMAGFAVVPAQGIQDGIISGWYLVYDPFFYKGLQCSVHSNPVKCRVSLLFNISVRQCTFVIKEKVENLLSAFGNAQAISL